MQHRRTEAFMQYWKTEVFMQYCRAEASDAIFLKPEFLKKADFTDWNFRNNHQDKFYEEGEETMKKKKQEKTKSQKRVLVVSVVLAMLIVAGETFAWFTSKDEVTNKLSASSNYNVTVGENFIPTTSWTPGQVVNKDVTLVNSGSVDAIARAILTSEISLTTESTPIAYTAKRVIVAQGTGQNGSDTSTTVGTANTANMIELSKTAPKNEANSLQAGGRLVVEANNILDEDNIKDGTDYSPKTTGLYIFRRTTKEESTGNNVDEFSGYYYVAAESDKGGQGTYYKIEHINGSTSVTTTTNSNDTTTITYTADLVTKSTVKIPDIDLTSKEYSDESIANKSESSTDKNTTTSSDNKTVTNVYTNGYTIAFTYTDANKTTLQSYVVTTKAGDRYTYDYTYVEDTSNPRIIVSYEAAYYLSSDTNKTTVQYREPVIININLDTNWKTNWTLDRTTNTFYYNYKLKAGTTSEKLVDSLELDSNVTNDAYINFDYSLNVIAESVQVVTESDGTESAKAVTSLTTASPAWWSANAETDIVTHKTENNTSVGTANYTATDEDNNMEKLSIKYIHWTSTSSTTE
jgi:alternate signal-mediated exported protein